MFKSTYLRKMKSSIESEENLSYKQVLFLGDSVNLLKEERTVSATRCYNNQ